MNWYIIIIDFYSYTCQAGTHKRKYQHNNEKIQKEEAQYKLESKNDETENIGVRKQIRYKGYTRHITLEGRNRLMSLIYGYKNTSEGKREKLREREYMKPMQEQAYSCLTELLASL